MTGPGQLPALLLLRAGLFFWRYIFTIPLISIGGKRARMCSVGIAGPMIGTFGPIFDDRVM
jgi:hypothetical protein